MYSEKRRRLARIACCWMFLLAMWTMRPSAFAQNAQGTIVGHVTDPSGAVVVGATVIMTDKDTNVSTTLTTNSAGDYSAAAINPGNYSITADAPGFSHAVSGALILEVQQTLRQDFKLTLGSASATMEVSSQTQMLMRAA